MAQEYTIPELLNIVGIRGYTPRLATAINTLLRTNSELDYQTALKEATIEIKGYQNATVFDNSNDAYAKSSHFEGIPIYMPLLLESVDGGDDYLLESSILEINRQRNIVVTNVQGNDSSVKEFINNGDYSITVSGLVCNKGVGYPKESIKELDKFLSHKGTVKIVHEVLNMLGIYEIVVMDYSFASTPLTNAQPYYFNALSEQPIELSKN